MVRVGSGPKASKPCFLVEQDPTGHTGEATKALTMGHSDSRRPKDGSNR